METLHSSFDWGKNRLDELTSRKKRQWLIIQGCLSTMLVHLLVLASQFWEFAAFLCTVWGNLKTSFWPLGNWGTFHTIFRPYLDHTFDWLIIPLTVEIIMITMKCYASIHVTGSTNRNRNNKTDTFRTKRVKTIPPWQPNPPKSPTCPALIYRNM